LLSAVPAWADGDFYVVAVGSGVGTKITSLPYTIDKPGFYYLTGNLTCTSGNGITINVTGVTIDLMGFSLDGKGVSQTGINNGVGWGNLEVRNGTLVGWNAGFLGGPSNRAINLRVENCNTGIDVSAASLVKGCMVVLRSVSSVKGIGCGGVITGNTVVIGEGVGIYGSGTISGNDVVSSNIGIKSDEDSSIIGNRINGTNYGLYLGKESAYSAKFLVTQNTASSYSTPFHSTPSAIVVNVNNAGF